MNRIAAGGLIVVAVVILSVRDIWQPRQDVAEAKEAERPPPPAPKLKASFMMGPTLKFLYCYS